MGDLIGKAVEGALYYVPFDELERVKEASVDEVEQTALFADLCRINALYMIARAGSGHIGSCFSCLDIVAWLHLKEMRKDDIYFSSKGHDAPALYAVLLAQGKLPFELIHKLRRAGGLPGHPDVSTPHIVTNTGSLGMGISKAKGMVWAQRMGASGSQASEKQSGKQGRRHYVLTGDGELQEGQIWESLVSAANHAMHEIIVVVDHNKLQSDTTLRATSDLGDLEAKFASFGWHVERIDGHDVSALKSTLARLHSITDKPKVVIADTIKGCGVSFMQHTAMESDAALYRFHSGAPDASSYTRAAQELMERVAHRQRKLGLPEVHLETVQMPSAPASSATPQRLIAAYSDALLKQTANRPNLVVLDADLMLDTGQKPTKDRFPERFIECGIAEMDMVSQAGGLALSGYLPVCHSFACFLSTRPNEQIYNNATERTKVVYVASLAGVVPGGPGHSHQSVRDISTLSAVPGLLMAEPCCEAEVGPLFSALLQEQGRSGYLRLISVPYDVPFSLPEHYVPQVGQGVVLREGSDAIIFAYGLIMVSEAYRAAERLKEEFELDVKVVNLPWLNHVDPHWLAQTVRGCRFIFTMDNHYIEGGQGSILAGALLEHVPGPYDFHRFGLTDVPAYGSPAEVLKAHGLDSASVAELVRERVQ